MALNYCLGSILKLYIFIQFLSFASAFVLEQLQTDYTTEYYARQMDYGYEEVPVVTSDGYHLMIHRITSKKVVDKSGPVVLIMHGLFGSSCNYNVCNKSLAYALADQGCDVYLGNARGNQYSLKHDYLLSVNPLFWAFSWDEIASLDLPAMIDHILEFTGQEKLAYIGHSQGASIYYALASERPDYAATKISSVHLLSPVVFMEHFKGDFLKVILAVLGIPNPLADYVGAPFLPNTFLTKLVGEPICKAEEQVCENLLTFLYGSSENIDTDLLPDMLRTIPAGVSLGQVQHYAQLIRDHGFHMFDYGFAQNLIKYKSFEPKNYDLSRANNSMCFYYGGQDNFSQLEDIEKLFSMLNPDLIKDKHYLPHWSHLDYFFSKHMDTELHPFIYENIQKFN